MGALVGAFLALVALDPHFIIGNGGKWIHPENDYNAYLVAWNYYIVDGWRLPIFNVPNMGYPEGGSVLFNDALPIVALPTKIVYHLAGLRINPFGWWIFLTYVLQGAMAARLVCAVGLRSVWPCIAAAILAICSGYFLARMSHTALSSHFLILWALALHFESVRRGAPKLVESWALLVVALLVNSYLFAMVVVLEVSTLLVLGTRRQLSVRHLRAVVLGFLTVVALAVLAGYGVLFVNPTTMKGSGYGLYSWNLAALLLPPDGVFGYLARITRDATGGQYEGDAYIGRGAVLLLLAWLAWEPRKSVVCIRSYHILALTLFAFAVYAASNRVYAGKTLLVAYYLPDFVIDISNYFRATGRFIWPLSYSLSILPVACIFRWWRPAPAIAITGLAVFLQVSEVIPALRSHRRTTALVYDDLIDTPRMSGWLADHNRLWQYPSWACGGLGGSKRSWGNLESNRELQVQLAAARAGVSTNSVYTSRQLKSCSTEIIWLATPLLEDGVLYVLGPEAVQASTALTTLARSTACVGLDWAVICSLKWARMADPPSNPTAAVR
jgi:hypothetical protein